MSWLGVEIGGTKLQVAVVTDDGQVAACRQSQIDATAGAAAVQDELERLLAEALGSGAELRGVGVGFGGPVDRLRGTVAACHQVAGWSGFPLAAWIADRTRLSVVIENDSNAAAVAEAVAGAGRGSSAVVYANAGSGVGAGYVMDGRIHHGRSPGEMEFGHLRLAADGPTVEQEASGWSLDRRVFVAVAADPRGPLAAAAAGAVPSARHLGAAIDAGDPEASAILDRAARAFALGLSHVVHLLNPDVIVLGGGVAHLGEPWRGAIAAHLDSFVVKALAPAPPVRLAALGDLVVPLGAAIVARTSLSPFQSSQSASARRSGV
jgi:glucokinase